jgi:signal transduction histidine kinase
MHKLIGSMLEWLPVRRLLGVDRITYTLSTHSPESLRVRTFSHAISTPMTSLLLYLETCLSNPHILEERRVKAELKALTSHLKSLYQEWMYLHHSQPHAFSVMQTIKQAILTAGHQYKQAVSVQCNAPANIRLLGSSIVFQEVIVCLLRNAYEAYPHHESNRPISCIVTKRPTSLHVDIIDAGNGMNSLALLVAGMPGITFKEQGTGIGLYLSRDSLRQHFGGELHIASAAGVGTRVTLELPLSRPNARHAR